MNEQQPQVNESKLYIGMNQDRKLAMSKDIQQVAGKFNLFPQYKKSKIGNARPVVCVKCGWRGLTSETLFYKLKLDNYPQGINHGCPFCWRHEQLLRETLADDEAEII